MTKAQTAAFDYIDSAISKGAKTIAWADILVAVKKAPVPEPKNWMRIRDVVADYTNDGSLVRSSNKRIEEYSVDKKAWLKRS